MEGAARSSASFCSQLAIRQEGLIGHDNPTSGTEIRTDFECEALQFLLSIKNSLLSSLDSLSGIGDLLHAVFDFPKLFREPSNMCF